MPKTEKKKAVSSTTDDIDSGDSGPNDRPPVAKKAKGNESSSFGHKDEKPKAQKKKYSADDSDSEPDDRAPVAKKAKGSESSSGHKDKKPKAQKKKSSSDDSDSGPDDRAPVAKKPKRNVSSSGHKIKKPKEQKNKLSSDDSDSGPVDRTPVANKAKGSASSSSGQKDADGNTFFELDKTKRVTISEFKGKTYVSIREYYEKDGKLNPGKKGISLQPDLWKKLLEVADDINELLGSK